MKYESLVGPIPTGWRIAAIYALAATLAAGCTARAPAPVSDRTVKPKSVPAAQPPAVARPAFYMVRSGDTLYSIALDHGLDYRELAAWNGITRPDAIRAGQQLRMTPPPATTTTATAPFKTAPGVEGRPIPGAPGPAAGTQGPGTGSPAPAAPAAGQAAAPEGIKTQPQGMRVPYSDQAYAQLASIKVEPASQPKPQLPGREEGSDGVSWTWPATGKVTSTFNGATNKGIDVSGRAGQPIYASADGSVIFSGTASGSLSQLGKFVVIKHGAGFNSVYAHNRVLHVKEGQTVTKGQKIAEMGNTDADEVKLHFEIRRFGRPQDPIKLLPPASD